VQAAKSRSRSRGPREAESGSEPDGARPGRDELAARREQLLFERSRSGDQNAREQLLGLVKAVDRFDPGRGLRFSSFAVPTILGELKRHFRDHTWAVHVPRGLNELSLSVDRAAAELERRDGRAPTVTELGAALGVGVEDVLEALQVSRSRRIASLDAPVSPSAEGLTVGDRLASPRAAQEHDRAEKRVLLESLMTALPKREQCVLRLRYEADLTQQEIAERVGVSQMQISRLIRQSLDRLSILAEAQPAARRPLAR
jgi:RNA polymerase sigma-B factor